MWVDTTNINQNLPIITMLMAQANNESEEKSRMIKGAWQHKRNKAKEKKPMGKNCPAWIDYKEGRYVFNDNAAIIRRVFTLYVEGVGSRQIAKLLNGEGVKPFTASRKKTVWTDSHIRYILTNKATIGEYQPQDRGVHEGTAHRSKIGEAIANFYPSVISDELFWRAQGIKETRRTKGRKTSSNTGVNLFNGILRDAVSKSPVWIKVNQYKGQTYRYLVPSVIQDGSAGFSYNLLELAFLHFVRELVIDTPTNDDTSEQVAALEAIIADQKSRLERLSMDDDFDQLKSMYLKIQDNLRSSEMKLSMLKTKQASKPADDLVEAKLLVDRWEEAIEAGKVDEFREIMRNKIAALVSEMWMLVEPENRKTKTAIVQVFLRSGGVRWLVVHTGKENYIGTCLDGEIDPATDLRHYTA